MTDNTNRFASLVTPATPAPEAIPGQTILEPAKALADKEQALIREAMGIALDSQQFYANGTKMLACGEATAVAQRRQWEDLPTVTEGTDKFIQIIKDEQRVDHRIFLNQCHIDRSGVLRGVNGGVLLNDRAWGQLANNFQDDLKRKKKVLPSGLRNNFNLWLPHSHKTGLFRTRYPKDTGSETLRECFAAMGARYGVYDLDQIARDIQKYMPKDSHLETRYDGSRGVFDVSLAPVYDVEAGEVGVGRAHRILTTISSADDGSESLRIKFKAVRIRCINCTLISDSKLVFERRHVGEDLGIFFLNALQAAGVAMATFSDLWKEANEKEIVDRGTKEKLPPAETFKRLIAHGYVKVPWVKEPDLLAHLMAAFEKEPGDTAAHINMAISRLAHEGASEWKSPWYVDDLEEAAGNILFAHVYSLKPLNEEQEAKFAS